MNNQADIIFVVVSIIGLLFVLGLVLGYSIALHHYFPYKLRKGRTPGQLIDSLDNNDGVTNFTVIDRQAHDVRSLLIYMLFLFVIIPHLIFILSYRNFFVNVEIWGWLRVLTTILFFVGIILLLLFTTLKNPFRNVREQDIQNQDVQGDLTVTEKNPQQGLIFTVKNPLSEVHEFLKRAVEDPTLYCQYAQEIQEMMHGWSIKNELIRLQRLKEELSRIYRQHFWLKLHRNPRKRKQCNPEYVRRWFGMMNLPYYDESEDSFRKKQYYLPSYYRRRVRDFT